MAYGVQNIIEIVEAGLSAGKLIVSLSDGVGLSDLKPALELAKLVKPAVDDAELALEEYLDMDDEEALQVNAVVAKFDIENDDVERAVKVAISVAIELRALAALFKKPEIVPVPA